MSNKLEDKNNNLIWDEIINDLISQYDNVDNMIDKLQQEERYTILVDKIEIKAILSNKLYDLGIKYDKIYWDSKINGCYIIDEYEMELYFQNKNR